MKITIYTVNDCEFSKQEKAYLQSHNLQFEEKNLELNKEFLTEMLAVSDNFAGTPVTRIEKDDGSAVVLKGFTAEEFDENLGFKKEVPQAVTQDLPQSVPASVAPPSSQPNQLNELSQTPPAPAVVNPPTDLSGGLPQSIAPLSPTPPTDAGSPTPPAPPVVEPPPVQLSQEPPASVVTAPEPPAVTAPEPPKQQQDPRMASILGNLQSMSSSSAQTPTTVENTVPSAANLPSVPDPNFG